MRAAVRLVVAAAAPAERVREDLDAVAGAVALVLGRLELVEEGLKESLLLSAELLELPVREIDVAVPRCHTN